MAREQEKNYQHFNANPMIPHPMDKVFRVITKYNSSGFYRKEKTNLFKAKAEAQRLMNSDGCNQDMVIIVAEIDVWERTMVPKWKHTTKVE